MLVGLSNVKKSVIQGYIVAKIRPPDFNPLRAES